MPKRKINLGKALGPIVTTLIVVLVILAVGLYLFASHLNDPSDPWADRIGSVWGKTPQNSASRQLLTNPSDDPASLRKDLNKSTRALEEQN